MTSCYSVGTGVGGITWMHMMEGGPDKTPTQHGRNRGHAWENQRNSQGTEVPSPSQMEAKPSSLHRKIEGQKCPLPPPNPSE